MLDILLHKLNRDLRTNLVNPRKLELHSFDDEWTLRSQIDVASLAEVIGGQEA